MPEYKECLKLIEKKREKGAKTSLRIRKGRKAASTQNGSPSRILVVEKKKKWEIASKKPVNRIIKRALARRSTK